MKKQNGITLIALIITIIVMLILVGVTVATALNGGLFSTANTASKGTNKAMIEEQMTSAVLGFMNQNLLEDADIGSLKAEILKIKGIASVDGEAFPLTVKDENGNEWTIDQKGTIEPQEPEVEKIISADDEEASYWKTDGQGTILYYEPAEGVEVPETLVVPCQIGDEKITRIGEYALTAVRLERNEDGSFIPNDEGYPMILDTEIDENGMPAPTGPTVKVKNIVVSKGIQEIAMGAFSFCTGLTNITLPEGLITIGAYAFQGCTLIKEITIPSTVDNLGGRAFDRSNNENLTIYVRGKTEQPADVDNEEYNSIGWSHAWADGANANIVWDK